MAAPAERRRQFFNPTADDAHIELTGTELMRNTNSLLSLCRAFAAFIGYPTNLREGLLPRRLDGRAA